METVKTYELYERLHPCTTGMIRDNIIDHKVSIFFLGKRRGVLTDCVAPYEIQTISYLSYRCEDVVASQKYKWIKVVDMEVISSAFLKGLVNT